MHNKKKRNLKLCNPGRTSTPRLRQCSHSSRRSQPAPSPKAFPKPNPPSLTSESSNRASNEFKLEKQGYKQVTSNAGIWDIIPLILDLEASLNFAIGSRRPHSELKTVEKHNSDKRGYEATDCPCLYAFVQASS